VTAAKFDVTLAAADTETVEKGFYQYQARATLGGLKHNIRFTPNRIHIKESVFVNPSQIKDYY
jgi:hypothetical protein